MRHNKDGRIAPESRLDKEEFLRLLRQWNEEQGIGAKEPELLDFADSFCFAGSRRKAGRTPKEWMNEFARRLSLNSVDAYELDRDESR